MIRAAIVIAILAAGGTALASTSHCHERSPIVGRRHCGAFGSRWAHTWLNGFLDPEGGLAFEHIRVPALDDTGMVSNPTSSATYHAQLLPGSRRTMSAIGPRYRWGFRGTNFMLGVEITVGFALDAPTSVTQVDGFAPITSHSGFVFDGGGVTGLQTRVGPLELAAQVSIGMRALSLAQNLPAGFTLCPNGATGKSCGLVLSETDLLVEPRVRVEYWLRPQVTFGVAVGVDLIHGGQSVGLTFAFHGAPYDGS